MSGSPLPPTSGESDRGEGTFVPSNLAIIGAGVVGQATGVGFARKGHEVIFCDINLETLTRLQAKGYKTTLPHLLDQESGVEAFFMSISTPTVDEKIQLGNLEAATANLGSGILKKRGEYCIVVVRSTVPPGTIEGMIIPILEKYSGKKAGRDFGVCMNPEFLRENRNEADFQNPWIVLIGELDPASGAALERIYRPFECPVYHVPLKEAEMEKYVHNIFNASVVSFFNEMRVACEKLGVDADVVFPLVRESAEASWNRAYGRRNLGPFAGSCLPKDTMAFLTFMLERGVPMPLLKGVIAVNETMKKKYNGNGGK